MLGVIKHAIAAERTGSCRSQANDLLGAVEMTSLAWMNIANSAISLFLAIAHWPKLFAEGDVANRYAGPIWLLGAFIWAFNAYRNRRRPVDPANSK